MAGRPAARGREDAMIVLKGGRLIDGTGAAPARDNAIVIRDGRVEAVTTAGANTWSKGAEVVDVSGKTIMPGLIDCHDHMALHGYDLARRWHLDEPSSTRSLRTAQAIRQTLEQGYTAVRDAGGLDAGFRQAVDEGLIRGPRLYTAIAIISPIGGIGDPVAPSGHECLVPPDSAMPRGVARGVEDLRNVVRTMVRAGADVIKCATTGGASSRKGHGPKDAAFTLEEMRALVDEAHALGRKVMCHALGGPGLRVALEAGVDSIEHGCYLAEDPELIPMMVEKGIVFVPTLLVYEFHRDSPSPHVKARARALQAHHVEAVQRALEAGVKIVAGTDAGGHGHPPNAGELPLLAAAGLAPMQALRAATGWAAECLGIDRELGTVEKEKLADLVVVDGDPLADLRILTDLARIRIVGKESVSEV